MIFVFIDLLMAYGVWKRPEYFVLVFVLFMLEQLYSHGNDLVKMWELKHKIDWRSVFTILYLPVVCIFLILDSLNKRE